MFNPCKRSDIQPTECDKMVENDTLFCTHLDLPN